MAGTPKLDGVHHLKLPVSDLDRSRSWYESRLGYEVEIEFVEDGRLMGVSMRHPNGGPTLALRLDPERAAAAAGFDYFSFGVPDKATIDALAQRLTDLGDRHEGVHFATIGWILPGTSDPDGHEVRFYTTEAPPRPSGDGPMRIENPRETSAALEAAMRHTRGCGGARAAGGPD
jgi:catechol 2,3-dioxygenase-like lactoylglutathione lyase family enzyme